MHERRKTGLYSFAVLPAIGFVLSAIAHVAALIGRDGPLGNYTLLFAYAVLNFVLSLVMPSAKSDSGLMTPSMVRSFSGHWTVLYATAAAMLDSAANVDDWDRRCRKGHSVGAVATFCGKCRQPLAA